MFISKLFLSIMLLLGVITSVSAQQVVNYSNVTFAPITATATGFTSSAINLSPVPSGAAGSFSIGNITVVGTALTTVTFSVQGSSDGGTTWANLNVNNITSPGTYASSVTATASGVYQVNLVGITQVRFVTSGTFTATSVKFTLTASPNGTISRSTGAAAGTVTSFSAPSASWPIWLVPSVTSATTTPTLTVAASTIPITAGGTGATTASDARTALGLGTAATYNIGTSGGTIGLLNTANTHSAAQTINGTAAVASLTLQNTTAATSSANYPAPSFALKGTYWNGTSSVADGWTIAPVDGTGANPSSTLNIGYSGSSGVYSISMPAIAVQSNAATPAQVTNITTGTGYVNTANFLSSAISAGGHSCINIGVASSSNNAASLCFSYTGAGSTANKLEIYGFAQATPSFSTDMVGNTVTNATLKSTYILPATIYSNAGTALPTCAVGIKGADATVSDATSPTYMGAYTSGGTITAKVICSYNGTTYSWLTH